jgi:predicted nucleic acid-binding Zn ribbon protein
MPTADKLSDIIENYIKDKKLKSKLNSSKIFNYWEEIVGKEIAKNSKPEKLKNKILYISTSNPIWATELSLLSQELIKKINEFLKEEAVTSLKVKPNF